MGMGMSGVRILRAGPDVIRAFFLALCKIPLFLAGLLVVAVLIPFRKTDESTRLPNGWVFTNFGTWWGNPFDGLMGDKRLDYWNDCLAKGWGPYRSMWHWAAWRNPVNSWSRMAAGVDVSQCVITKRFGQDVVEADQGLPGWQYLVATHASGKTYPRFFAEILLGKTHILLIDLGWKIKLSHNGTTPDACPQDRYKGLVFTVSTWKAL